jgi:hypothetical protein
MLTFGVVGGLSHVSFCNFYFFEYMNNMSPIVAFVFQENAFVHVTNIGGSTIDFENMFWNNMFEKNCPNIKIGTMPSFCGHYFILSTLTQHLAMFSTTFTIVLLTSLMLLI